MADRKHRGHAVYGLALIACTLLLHYGWAWVPEAQQARVWNISGALARLVLLGAVAVMAVTAFNVRSRLLLAGWCWWIAEELLVVGCNGALLYAPKLVPPGFSVCQSLLQIEYGRIGALAAALLLLPSVRAYRGTNEKEG